MTTISDRINADERLDDVTMTDDDPRSLLTEAAPVLAFPAVALGAAAFAAGYTFGEAID